MARISSTSWQLRAQAELERRKREQAITPKFFWQPQPKQRALLEACGLLEALDGGPVRQPAASLIGYGGAAFGGKTEGLLGVGLIACMMIPGVQVGFFRREFTELEGSDGPIFRSQEIFRPAGAKYNEAKHVWKFKRLSALRFCHCHTEKDVFGYQSQAFDILLIDEATHFTWFIVDYLLTRNRVSKFSTVPSPFAVMCTNPGNTGHHWYMKTFGIDPDGYYHPGKRDGEPERENADGGVHRCVPGG